MQHTSRCFCHRSIWNRTKTLGSLSWEQKKIYRSAVYEFLKQTGLQLYRVNLTRQVGRMEHSGQSRPPGLDVILPVAVRCRGFNLPKKCRWVNVCKLCKSKIINNSQFKWKAKTLHIGSVSQIVDNYAEWGVKWMKAAIKPNQLSVLHLQTCTQIKVIASFF